MTLSPNATYGYGLPQSAQQPMMSSNDLSSIVQSLVGITTMLTQMLGPMFGMPAGGGAGQAYTGQNTLGGGANGGPSGCSMGGGAGCSGHDAASGASQRSGAPTPGRAADPLEASGGGPTSSAPVVRRPPASPADDVELPPIPTAGSEPDPAPPRAPAPAPPPPPSSKGQDAVNKAKEHLGTPYEWGGSAPGGFDCSGLVQYSLKQLGVDIPRTSQDQFKAGTPVEKDQLQPGDLVFFRGDPPGHVGMYIGNGEYIHAPQSGDVVKISKLDQGGSFSGARRYT